MRRRGEGRLVAVEEVAGVDFGGGGGEGGVAAVGDDYVGAVDELLQVGDDFAAEECGAWG